MATFYSGTNSRSNEEGEDDGEIVEEEEEQKSSIFDPAKVK
jgi:hypothetical protein